MASVEQREASHPVGLATLEMFDKYKELDEDKDSDEESFHLPLLDSEEDLASNNKIGGTPVQNGETEDDILNKFDCTTPDPVDPKVEDSILNDEIEDVNSDGKSTVIENKTNSLDSVLENGSDNTDIINIDSSDEPRTERNKIENNEIIQDQTKQIEISEKFDNGDVKEIENITNADDAMDTKTDEAMEFEEEEQNNSIAKTEMQNIELTKNNINSDDIIENKNINDESEGDSVIVEKRQEEIDQSKIHEPVMDIDANFEKSNKMSVEIENSSVDKQDNAREISKDSENNAENIPAEKMEIVPNKNSEKEEETDEIGKTNGVSACDISDNSKDNLSDFTKTMENETATEETNNLPDSSSITVNKDDNKVSEISGNKSIVDSVLESAQKDGNVNESLEMSEENLKKDVCDIKKTDGDTDGSGNSENLECDDLLDISVICDVDEDNAKAVAENANDGQTSEKSDNDEQDDKADNDVEESENDQEERDICSSDKDDPMEFEDCASNSTLQFEENSSTNDNVAVRNVNEKNNSDSLDSSDIGSNKDDVEMVDVIPKVIAGLTSDSHDKVEKPQTEEKTELEPNLNVQEPVEEPVEYLDLDKHMAEQKKALETPQTGKRPLPSDDHLDVTTKKIRLSESPSKDDIVKKTDSEEKVKTLSSFDSYMRTKLFNKKLTKSDLEQFCIQKICEVIMHKTELGELHQMYRKQEQVIEVLRKDIQQLTKQARDLEIVNKKLMNEIKTLNGKPKPLVPLKITRSVGLQVKLNVSNDQTRKRAPNTPSRLSTGSTVGTPPMNNRQRTVTPNNNAIRQISSNGSSPRKPQPSPNHTTPILSQALQTPASRQVTTTPVNTAKRTPQIIRPKTADATKPSNPGVIDLTDEDDRSSKPAGAGPVKIIGKQLVTTSKLVPAKTVGKSPNISQNKMVNISQVKTGQVLNKGTPTRTVTTLPQGVRLTPTGVKNGIAIPANVVTSSSGGAQLMYVVQPTSSLVTTTAQGGQKTVLLNFQPGNGILTSAINGSAVSVIPTKANVQVKATPPPRKHPAPLPLPPPIQPNNNLKPLLPKPHLSIRKTETGIILQWRMPYNLESYECIASYQLFAYQETNAPPSTDMWRKVGDVKALALPMACTLTQFADKNKYYFAVRSVDVHKRIGAFSDPEEISL